MDEKFLKITNITYKILDFLPDSDPLKYKAKEKVLHIMEGAAFILEDHGWISLKSYFLEGRDRKIDQVLYDIGLLENYLMIARGQGWFDTVNFLIITKEYHNLKDRVKNFRTGVHKQAEVPSHAEDNIKGQEDIQKNKIESENLSGRQKKILEMLEKQNKAQVSDFIKELPNITKRTIRRDLDDLLKRRRIKRVGEWNQVFYTIEKEDKIDRT